MGDDVLVRVDCGQDPQNRLIPSSGSAVLNVYFSPTQFGKHTSLIDVIPDAKTDTNSSKYGEKVSPQR